MFSASDGVTVAAAPVTVTCPLFSNVSVMTNSSPGEMGLETPERVMAMSGCTAAGFGATGMLRRSDDVPCAGAPFASYE